MKWSGKFGQRAKIYPTRMNRCENHEATEFFRQVQSCYGANQRKIHSNVVRLTTAALVSKSLNLKNQVKSAQSVDQKLDFLADQNTIQAMITALSIATASHDPLRLKRMRTLFKKV